MLWVAVRSAPDQSMEDTMITEVARSPYVLLSVSVLLGSAVYLLALIR
jgi:hypothetical protein